MKCRRLMVVQTLVDRKVWICGWPFIDGQRSCASRHGSVWRYIKSEWTELSDRWHYA